MNSEIESLVVIKSKKNLSLGKKSHIRQNSELNGNGNGKTKKKRNPDLSKEKIVFPAIQIEGTTQKLMDERICKFCEEKGDLPDEEQGRLLYEPITDFWFHGKKKNYLFDLIIIIFFFFFFFS